MLFSTLLRFQPYLYGLNTIARNLDSDCNEADKHESEL